jgi:hypothetical protein
VGYYRKRLFIPAVHCAAAGMLVVVMLLPLSLPMYDGEFNHGGGGGGCGGPAAVAVAAVEAVEDSSSAKAASNEGAAMQRWQFAGDRRVCQGW